MSRQGNDLVRYKLKFLDDRQMLVSNLAPGGCEEKSVCVCARHALSVALRGFDRGLLLGTGQFNPTGA